MAVLAEVVKSVLVIVLLSSFLELMLPDGGIKPFVRFAIGLFILIAVLNPVLSYMFTDRNFQINLWDYTEDINKTEQILEDGREISDQIMDTGHDMMREKLEGQVSAVAVLVPGVQEVQAEVELNNEGAVDNLYLIVKPEKATTGADGDINVFSGGDESLSRPEQENIKNKIIQVMQNLYGLNSSAIKIEFEGG
ncbi:MAG: stage III sporulation protein AF [Syntrophomonadaceae bacterium]|nr:stage III sporulation protein AF [Syntrophomonadaceae bacterium]MDD3888516.1 stage III sporulation protein AF [Syntrophomonadaceae bacterium]MDD4548756.1 stage III sporulation protein AF [Syntrophomonadaceae bacterium]